MADYFNADLAGSRFESVESGRSSMINIWSGSRGASVFAEVQLESFTQSTADVRPA